MTGVVAEPRLGLPRSSRRTWRDLSTRERRFVVVGTAVDLLGKVAMLADLRRRPADRVRGPKWAWAASALINSAGAVPAGYFALGVKHR
ncbi:hypothetical protein [Cryptosporangium sp. NPDC051539]|uniref:hypothetical protein n=1 Tax=Cryptosporangium sp. NPDC051539 TaxID=3363962 RepID=UPI0037998BD0